MSSRIAELSAQISSNSQIIDDFLAANSLPQPSFDENGPVTLGLPAELEASRYAIINASAELQALLSGPDAILRPIVRFLSAVYTSSFVLQELQIDLSLS